MTGSLLELVAKGMEDVYLIGDPQVTLFITVYRRTSNFSMYDHSYYLKGCDFSKEFKLQFDYLGDLLHKLWLVVDVPEIILEKTKPTFNYIHSLLKSYDIDWDYSPQSPTAIVTLNNYNGGSINLNNPNTLKIFVSPFNVGDLEINLESGQLAINNSQILKIIGGKIILADEIPNLFQNPIIPQQILTCNVNILSGNIKVSTNSVFGDVFIVNSGTVTLNKINITNVTNTTNTTNYVYFISDMFLTSSFDKTILQSINSKITQLLETYNFYNNALILSKNSNFLIDSSVAVFDNYNPELLNSVSTIKNLMTNGRNLFMYLIKTLLSKYVSNYNSESPLYFFPKSGNDFLVQDSMQNSIQNRIIQMYSEDFKQTIFPYGLLLGALQSYSYDTLIYNSNYVYQPIYFITNDGNIISSTDNCETFNKITLTTNSLTTMWISSNNHTQMVADTNGFIYITSNGWETWNTINISLSQIEKIICSQNENTHVCFLTTLNQGTIYISFNYWQTFYVNTINLSNGDSVKDLIMSSDGLKITFVTKFGSIYTGNIDNINIMNNSNIMWTLTNTLPLISNDYIVTIRSSVDGANILQVIVNSNGTVYFSSDEWLTYDISSVSLEIITNNANSNYVTSFSMSNNGSRQIISDAYGNIYLSFTSGSTWSFFNKLSNYAIFKTDMISNDGDIQTAIDILGNLYISTDYGTRWETPINIQDNQNISINDFVMKNIFIPDSVSDSVANVYNISSLPLFGNYLTRPTTDKTNIIKFKLCDSDDIRMIFYVTFVNNILRQKIVLTQNEIVPFNPYYSTILRDINIRLSVDNLKVFDPVNTYLDDTLLFYHIIDSRVINYDVYSYDIGSATDVYFNSNVEANYLLYDKYNLQIRGHTREPYNLTDSYKVYKSFMKDVMGDIVNKIVKSKQQINLLATTLRYNIDLNIKYNFNQILNNITILTNSVRTNADHFIISFYRQYTLSGSIYASASSISFIPIIDNQLMQDNFKSLLNAVIQTSTPAGVSVINYFGNRINAQIKNFTTGCQNLFKATNYEDYISDYNLWIRVTINQGNAMLTAYNYVYSVYQNYPIIPATVFGRISLMNFIPFIVAKDMPVMIYNTFSKYGKQMMIDIGIDTESSQTNYNTFLSLIDFRDKDRFDMPNNYETAPDVAPEIFETKFEIYDRLITSLMLVSYNGGLTQSVQDSGYFSLLQTDKGSGSMYLLVSTLRPETYFCPYSTRNPDGTLEDISSDPLDIKSLPIEWLTQTYYNIMKSIIINFIDNLITDTQSNQYKIAKKTLVGTLENIINCFILRSDMPLYSNYKNNNYSLLGLTLETNSVIGKYKKSKEPINVTNPIYSDSISSIWYQVQKGFIQLYNGLFNDTLLSSEYYYSNLGNTMGSIFDYIKEQILDDDNKYYDSNGNNYPQSLPQSLLNSFVDVYKNTFSSVPLLDYDDCTDDVKNKILNYVGEIYPAVDTESSSSISTNQGFNFYRLNIGNPDDPNSKAYKINTYVKDYSLLYDYLVSNYESHKDIMLIKNDIDVLTLGSSMSQTLRKNTFQYEQSSTLIDYISKHIKNKYVEPIIDKKVRLNLIEIVDNTSTYWNPDVMVNGNFIKNNPTGIYGILDAIYNVNFVGSLANVLSKISGVPSGKNINDPIDFNDSANVPFTSYCLQKWYYELSKSYSPLKTTSEITYKDLSDILNLLNSVLYLNGNILSDRLITTKSILKNKFLAKLYTSENKKAFSCITDVSWFIFDLILTNKRLNKFINVEPLLQTIQNKTSVKFNTNLFENNLNLISAQYDNGVIETLQQLIVNYFVPILNTSIAKFEKISKFKKTASLGKYNGFNQYYNMSLNNNENTDIYYYEQSLDGICTINVPLENRLLNLINGIKPKYAWCKELGHKLIKNLSLSIDGQIIDSYTPELIHLVHNLTKSINHQRGYNILIGNTEEMYTYSNNKKMATTLMIPLNFYFCKLAGSSLPLLKLLYANIVLSGQINNIEELLYIEPDSNFKKIPKLKCNLLARHIYLDDDERKLIANTKMEYLIEKFNYGGSKVFSSANLFSKGANLITNTNSTVDLTNLKATAIFDIKVNDPIKYFVWYIKFFDKTTEQKIDILDWCDFGFNVRNSDSVKINISKIIKSIELKMNGVGREIPHFEEHYTHLIPYEKMMGSLENGEYLYSFALYPLLLQPTGSANYSEISDSSFIINFTDQIESLLKSNPNLEIKMELWGLAYNTLRCVSGMAGLVFNKP